MASDNRMVSVSVALFIAPMLNTLDELYDKIVDSDLSFEDKCIAMDELLGKHHSRYEDFTEEGI